jgi:chromate reductase, NAD(P)H dehydrogenase (quinone)
MKNIQLLAISGSLRTNSSNTNVLQAAKILSPPTIRITLYSELAQLAHFNPDLDQDPLPDNIVYLRQQIENSDGIIISSPEYAHGVPGTLKNALDWLVSSVEFPYKPVMLINTNPRATIAFASLQEILNTMSAKIIPSHNLTLAIARRGLDTQDIIDDPELSTSLAKAIAIFAQSI